MLTKSSVRHAELRGRFRNTHDSNTKKHLTNQAADPKVAMLAIICRHQLCSGSASGKELPGDGVATNLTTKRVQQWQSTQQTQGLSESTLMYAVNRRTPCCIHLSARRCSMLQSLAIITTQWHVATPHYLYSSSCSDSTWMFRIFLLPHNSDVRVSQYPNLHWNPMFRRRYTTSYRNLKRNNQN